MTTANAIEAPVGGGFFPWLRAISRPSLLAFGVGVLAVLSGAMTYAAVMGLLPYNPTPAGLFTILVVNAILGAALAGLIIWRLIRLWGARRSGIAGARLHVRLVVMFSLIAVVPAIFVAIFAAVTLNLGMESWFSSRVQTALDNAIAVARQYVLEKGRGITLDAGEIEEGLERDPRLFDAQKHIITTVMFEKLEGMTSARGLVGSILVDSYGHELGKSSGLSYSAALKPSAGDLAEARSGSIVVDGNPDTGIIHALIYMPFLNDAYLLVVRQVDPKVFGYYHRTTVSVGEYKRLEQNRSEVQLIFGTLYVVVSLVVLLAAVWLGLWAANRLVRPISSLIGAAERVSEGDLKAQVEVERDDDEVGLLGRAFNRMISQLDNQRTALVHANRQNEERRRFTEAVLGGVSAGVIGLDHDGMITIVNRAAARLLNSASEELEGRHYSESVPELAALIRRAITEPVGRAGGEVTVKRGSTTRALSVQVSSERGNDSSGYVATFDDITDLVSAQRTAAWADVARRIAHEIKNPLTPIQLSAERLKRKYANEVTTDPDVFAQCTDTIIRQVGDIGRMVDEFSSFARMPTPVMRRENAQELVQQAVFLQRVANPQIAFETRVPKDPVYVECDGRLVSQALTNILKNAGEGVHARLSKGEDTSPGRIVIALEPSAERVVFRVTDNGVGLPHEHRDRLTEPYVTTRVKGTGLGLAIVRKIMEDHGGELVLQDAGHDLPEDHKNDVQHGAEVVLVFPPRQKSSKEKGSSDEQERVADRV
ncbi:MAG TPA: PAS domain-containing sensor histidine kinase [Rhizomicrobium sp.]|jgi:two-component system nitrogen regulation sensor histidine kinase NtrY|nr:PAS domain-containing sensor histidine kinase [Rhizomicrobium sp.]